MDEGSLFLLPLKQKTSGGMAAFSAGNTTSAAKLSATVSSKSPPAETSAPAIAQLAPTAVASGTAGSVSASDLPAPCPELAVVVPAGSEAIIPQNVDAQVAPGAVSDATVGTPLTVDQAPLHPEVPVAAGGGVVAGAKRRREDPHQTQSAAAAEPDYTAYMPLQASYELLVRNCDARCMLTYSLLRSQGLVPLRHRKYATPADGAGLGPQPPRRRILFPVPHDEPLLEPVYDVYARDGITSFKPSAPGAPDFYVCVARRGGGGGALQPNRSSTLNSSFARPSCSASEAPPTPSQIARMQWQLKQHSAAARRSQLVKIGDRADLAILTPSEPQVKVAVVAHSTVTFYAMTVSQLGRE